MKNCPECNSEKIIKNVRVLDNTENYVNADLRIAVDENPDALIFKQRSYSIVKAKACGDCGFIQFYAEDPKMLWTAYQNQQNKI